MLFCFQFLAFKWQRKFKWLLWGGQYNDPHQENKPTHRIPPVPIYVNQDGHNLTFDLSLVNETVEVISNEKLLYTIVVGDNGMVEIPEYISGEVEIRLIRDNLIYHVTITV